MPQMDEKTLTEYMQTVINSLGWTVTKVETTDKALRISMEHDKPKAIITPVVTEAVKKVTITTPVVKEVYGSPPGAYK